MGVFHVFKIVQMLPNPAKHHICSLVTFRACLPVTWLGFLLVTCPIYSPRVWPTCLLLTYNNIFSSDFGLYLLMLLSQLAHQQLAHILTSDMANIIHSGLINMFTSALVNIFTSDQANILANTITNNLTIILVVWSTFTPVA